MIAKLAAFGATLLPCVSLFAAYVDAQPPSDGEPPLGALLASALDRAGLSEREIAAARHRSRIAGALPRLHLRVRRIAEDRRQAEEMNAGVRHRGVAEQALMLEAQVHFDLGRLVYGTDSVAWGREAREREERRNRRAHEIVKVYYERRRLLLERAHLHVRDPDLELRIHEAEALLDALTGGAFSRLKRPPAHAAGAYETERSGRIRAIR